MTKKAKKTCLLAGLLCSICFYGNAQLSLVAQIRTRTEVRNGLGNLVLKGSKPAVFTSQRTRLSIGYKLDRVTVGVSIQDIRVWGQDASSISNSDGNRLMLHEGWAEISLANKLDSSIKLKLVDQLSLKIGRQELSYDDVRLIGNLDWLQQARRHDMALLKLLHHGWQADIGFAFNQNSDAFNLTGTGYVPGNIPQYVKNSNGTTVPTPGGIIPLSAGGSLSNNSSKTGAPIWINVPGTNAASQQYKSFISLYVSKKIKQTKFSALLFNDQFGKYKTDSIVANGGYVYGRRFVSSGSSDSYDYSGTVNRYTYGVMFNQSIGDEKKSGKIALQAAYYHQSGKDRDANKLDAFHYTASLIYQKNKWSIGPGFDLLSGNDGNSTSTTNHRFDPLYGTPHRHWGYMDFFYVGTGAPAGGLKNFYLKGKYTGKTFSFGTDFHAFSLHKDMKKSDGNNINKKLGNEIDLLLNYMVNKFTVLEIGYSVMYAGKDIAIAKGQATNDATAENYRKSGTWLYAMINIRPEFLFAKADGKK